MKIIKKANGQTVLSIDKEEWVKLGKENGWKVAQSPDVLPPVATNPAAPAPTAVPAPAPAPAPAPVTPAQTEPSEDGELAGLDPQELKQMFQSAKSKLIQLFAPMLKTLGIQIDNQSQWEGLFKGLVTINQSTNLQADVELYRKLSRLMRQKQIV